MAPNSVYGDTSVGATGLELDGRPLGVSVHTPGQVRRRLLALLVVMAVLASLYPMLARSSYVGGADLHATIEIAGAVLGLIAGFALVMRFYAFGNRFHLLIGLAFFVNGAEDLVHGLLSFVGLHGLAGISSSSLDQFIPGTYVAGRLMLGVLLLSAPFAKSWSKGSEMPQRETVWGSCAALFLTLVVTAIAFRLPLPRFIYPEHFISRPADFVSALVLLAALVVFIREYRRTRDMLTWWVALSIGVNVVGQLMMSVSRSLYDPLFDISHAYKVLGYAVPLLGFSSYQVTVAGERRLALHSAFRQTTLLNAINRMLMQSMTCETEEEVAKTCLAVAEELTGSKFGFVGEINNAGRFDTITLTDPGWHTCRMPEEDATRLLKDMELRGIWSAVFRDERSVIVNDPASHPDRVGTPEGHPPLTSFLGVPLKQGGETIGMIGLANKESGYDRADREVVEALSVAFIEALQRKRAEDALRAHRDHLEELVTARTTDLSKANADLEARNRELDEFTYIASHDLQEPLRKLSAYSDLLQEDIKKSDQDEVGRDLGVLASAAGRMQKLVQDLLALSRYGRRSMKLEDVSLDDIVDMALDALALRIEETGAELVRSDLPVIRGDRSLVVQLYQNLIGNALKFCGDKPPRVELTAETVSGCWTLGVADNGIGLDPKYAEQIFSPFKRLHGRDDYEGTGIGLAICRKIVERHGGRIWVESERGKGAHFKFTLGELGEGVQNE